MLNDVTTSRSDIIEQGMTNGEGEGGEEENRGRGGREKGREEGQGREGKKEGRSQSDLT